MVACPHPSDQLVRLFPAQDYITGNRLEIVECRSCGFTVTSPQPCFEEMAAYYPAGYYGAPAGKRFPKWVEWLQQCIYGHRARQVANLNHGRAGRVLDIGCGRGLLLREFQRRGWEVQGTELSDQAASYAREVLRLPVRTGRLEELHFPDDHFDAVVMWHVLEHVSDPRTVLAEVRRILKPGGVFTVGVPNFGSWEARLACDKWFHLDVPRHLTHFTHETLRMALVNTGFTERSRSGFAPEYDYFSFVQSAMNWLGLRHNLLYNLLRGRGAKVLREGEAGMLQIAITLFLGLPLGVLSLPMTTVAALLDQGATTTIYAVKQPRPA